MDVLRPTFESVSHWVEVEGRVMGVWSRLSVNRIPGCVWPVCDSAS